MVMGMLTACGGDDGKTGSSDVNESIVTDATAGSEEKADTSEADIAEPETEDSITGDETEDIIEDAEDTNAAESEDGEETGTGTGEEETTAE